MAEPTPAPTNIGINTGMPEANADGLHKAHHYEVRSTILRFLSQPGQIDAKKYEMLVRFHASMIPDFQQYNRIITLLQTHAAAELARIAEENAHPVNQSNAAERTDALILACQDAEALIQIIMDTDLHIRERAHIGVN